MPLPIKDVTRGCQTWHGTKDENSSFEIAAFEGQTLAP